ncbi:MAG: universal stress protein [Treponema sp.]|nr:universal stress protein [Treponema sp.]
MIKSLFQKVVVAYNGSKSSLHAVMYAILMAKCYKCQVKVVSVVDTATIKQLMLTKFVIDEEGSRFSESLESDAKRNLDFALGLAKSKGVKIETEIRRGSVWSEIIVSADDFKADLILLGGSDNSNSMSSINRDVVSMQQSEIIGSAHCSVLVVRQNHIEQLFKIG